MVNTCSIYVMSIYVSTLNSMILLTDNLTALTVIYSEIVDFFTYYFFICTTYYLFTGEFMGDIAVADAIYETEWRSQHNKTIQEEIERLKHEVLQEGLQVEEEGLTDIIRKKTKQVEVYEQTFTLATVHYNKKINDPVVVRFKLI